MLHSSAHMWKNQREGTAIIVAQADSPTVGSVLRSTNVACGLVRFLQIPAAMLFFTSQALSVRHKDTLRRWFTTACEGSKLDSPSSWDPNWDLKADHSAKGIRQVVLIRHGQYVQGVKGDEHRVLTELGESWDRIPAKKLR
jgi:hypothetical protein